MPAPRPTRPCLAMENLLQQIAAVVESACELASIVTVALGGLGAVLAMARAWRRLPTLELKRDVWVRFAAWILLSLEFALAADIVGTAIAPSWDAIGKLAAIAAVRTVLNWFLEKDLDPARSPKAATGSSGKGGAVPPRR
jgi:uncharacterized membrane protein